MGAKQKVVSAAKSVRKKRRIVAIITVLVIMCAILAYFFVFKPDSSQQIELRSESATAGSEIEAMLQNPVNTKDSIDTQIAYYDKLAKLYEVKGEYRNAAQTMDRRISVSKKGMTHAEYISVASYYYAVKDIDNALRYLDIAEAKLITVDRPGAGYYYQDWKDNIQALREEYQDA